MDASTWRTMVVSWIITSGFDDAVKQELLSCATSLTSSTLHIFLSKLWKYCKQYNITAPEWLFPTPEQCEKWLGE